AELFSEPAKIHYDQASQTARTVRDYNTGFSNCVPTGKYTAEFYLNGKRVSNLKTKIIDVPEFETYRSRDLNMSLCHPKGWTIKHAVDDRHGRHLVRGLANKDGKNVVYLFTFFAVRNPTPGPIKEVFVGRAWTWLKHIFKKSPSDDEFRKAIAKFSGCKAPIPRGAVLHKAWVMPDGMAHVAFVIGSYAKDGDACRVLNSVGNYYGRGDANELEPL
ncbi:MAG: hypothetical protein K0U34_06220, partial [Alphaproteobacteria bacterium]|nr:hypothetical protein [Alphaproteobacteria bacterium]